MKTTEKKMKTTEDLFKASEEIGQGDKLRFKEDVK